MQFKAFAKRKALCNDLWALDGIYIVPTSLTHLLDVLHEVLIEVRSRGRWVSELRFESDVPHRVMLAHRVEKIKRWITSEAYGTQIAVVRQIDIDK